jgi:hypothetical protein
MRSQYSLVENWKIISHSVVRVRVSRVSRLDSGQVLVYGLFHKKSNMSICVLELCLSESLNRGIIFREQAQSLPFQTPTFG